jgi:hypothetical protein
MVRSSGAACRTMAIPRSWSGSCTCTSVSRGRSRRLRSGR